mmetsp:Transcript_36072/g.91150  ORF Transcript_36072/g.91150 Transcript_36072/m.91150 type:complete len:200 (+) Transcript_36072:1829-2428(+)
MSTGTVFWGRSLKEGSGTFWSARADRRASSASVMVLEGSSPSRGMLVAASTSSDRSSLANSSRYSRTSALSKISGFTRAMSRVTSRSETMDTPERLRPIAFWASAMSAPVMRSVLPSTSQSHSFSLLPSALSACLASPNSSSRAASRTMRSSMAFILSRDLACSISSPSPSSAPWPRRPSRRFLGAASGIPATRYSSSS